MDAIVDGGGCLRLFYLLSVRMISSASQERHADYFRLIFCCFEYMEMIFPCYICLQRLRTWLNVEKQFQHSFARFILLDFVPRRLTTVFGSLSTRIVGKSSILVHDPQATVRSAGLLGEKRIASIRYKVGPILACVSANKQSSNLRWAIGTFCMFKGLVPTTSLRKQVMFALARRTGK